MTTGSGVRVGFDIGGTFTDLILVDDSGRALVKKIPSSPANYAAAAIEGLRELLAMADLPAGSVAELVHGTTVATNAILERKGALTGLITTIGYRDVLEIGRLRMPGLYNLDYQRPAPLVPRGLRMEVEERLTWQGEPSTAVDVASVERAVDRLKQSGVASIAVCLLHSYANASHELIVGKIVKERAPDIYLSLSSEVDPDIGEFERTSTVVANAYVMPVINGYVTGLDNDLQKLGVTAPLLIMQSSGGTMSAPVACAHPVAIIESGPAAGVVATAALGRRLGEPNMLSVDIGGTTAKAAVIEDYRIRRTNEFQIGGPISEGSRLNNGGGFAIRAPAIDLAEVGAGGGSIVGIDAVGSLRIGPESAGAAPGPVCYDRGGTRVTVTDANLCLGYLNPAGLASGLKLDIDKARAALRADVGERTGLSTEEAAHGIFLLASAAMARAARSVTIERGRDPREFAMVAFGGNGPLFAVSIARALEITRVIIPPTPGVFSAIGLLEAPVERHITRPYRHLLSALSGADVLAEIDRVEHDAMDLIRQDGFEEPAVAFVAVDMRYRGQSYPLRVSLSGRHSAESVVAELVAALDREHHQTYGFHGDDKVAEIVSLIATASISRRDQSQAILRGARIDKTSGSRPAYFGRKIGYQEAAVIGRHELSEIARPGPLLIEEYDATALVPPGATARIDASGNILIDVGSAE